MNPRQLARRRDDWTLLVLLLAILALVACTVVIGRGNTVESKGDAKVNTTIEPTTERKPAPRSPPPLEKTP